MHSFAAGLRRALLVPILGLAASCVTTHVLPLSPANESARQSGALTARLESQYVFGGPLGSAEITSMAVTMPDGEVLKGAFNPDGGGAAGYGAIYDAAYGPAGSHDKSVVHRGAASLVGDRSTSMQCEFYTKTFSGHVTGACRTSRDELYEFHD